jgi:peptidylprolyl isomerase
MAGAKKGDKVRFHYTLTLKDGRVVESNVGGEPLELVVGKGKAIKGLENGLIGLGPGQTRTVVVKPADGYGHKDQAFIWTLAAAELPPGTAVAPETEVSFARPDGTRVEGRIAKVEGDRVTVDGNHPLAGRNLTFEIKVVSVG